MSLKMLINGQRAEQLRVAIIDGTTLCDYQVDIAMAGLCRGNIYRGVIGNIQPGLNAAFVDIGEDRHGFLPVGDVLPSAYHRTPPADERRPRIDQVLERGRPVLVQVTKDGSGQKGPALTTNVALAGRYLVLMPFDDVRGISRKVEDDKTRKKVRERLAKLDLPEGQGVIVRTNAMDQNQTTLGRDLNALLRLWKRVHSEASRSKGAQLLYSDQDLIVQALRDYLDSSIEQVIVDTDEAYEKVRSYMQAFMPRSKTRLIRYRERLPLFSRYHLEPQIERIYDRSVPLKGGGSIVIDGTEALTAIDVNSGRTSGHGDHDETLLTVNLEAADEVARQLRQRDIGGLVVVDFIDMRPRKHQRKLEKTLRDALKVDKARTTVSRISANGLIEINRQRIKQALRTRSHRPCVACNGIGSVPTQEFAALGLMRRIEARAATGLIEGITLALHSEIADALQNNHRRELAQLEHEFDLKIDILASPNMSRIEQRIEWTKREGSNGAAVHSRAPVLTAIDLATPGLDERRPQRHGDLERAGDEADGSGRRRRRRRRRGPGDRYEHGDGHGDGHSDEHGDGHSDGHSDEAPDEALRTAVAEDSDGTEEAATAEDEDSRGRRRRRGGRRRRRAEPRASEETATREAATREAVAANGEDEVTTPVEPASEAATEGDEVSRPKRRRRPARRRRRPTDGAPAEDLDTGHEVAAADADAASQRRPRSRRRPRSGEDSEEVATASSGVRNADISAADDEPRSRPRRRSSRDRRLADGNNPNSRDEATAAAAETATAVAAAATTAASAEAAADDCGERPSRRRRSTRQSRPAGDSGKVATDDDSSTGAAAAGAPNAQRFAEGDSTHLPFRPRYRSKDTSDAGNDRLPSEPRYRTNAASDADNDRQRPEPQQQVEVKPVTSLRDAEAEAWNWLRPPAREEV